MSTYWGILTQTITSTNDPRLSVGQVLIGTYTFQSNDPAAEGTYCQRNNKSDNGTLQLTLCCYYPNDPRFSRSAADCSEGAYLTVTAHAVSDFYCADESGFVSMTCQLATGFSFRSQDAVPDPNKTPYLTQGQLTFTRPIALN